MEQVGEMVHGVTGPGPLPYAGQGGQPERGGGSTCSFFLSILHSRSLQAGGRRGGLTGGTV